MTILSADALQKLYATFREASAANEGWHRAFQADVEAIRAMDDATFTSAEGQARLWRARGVSSIGPGESVDVTGAYTDPLIVEILRDLRHLKLPADARQRGAELNKAYDRILGLVSPKHTKPRPLAKLFRVFTCLFPDELHTCYTYPSRKNLIELVVGTEVPSFPESGVLVRERMREVLGPEPDMSESIWRAIFCWWLHEKHATIVKDGADAPTVAASASPASSESVDQLVLWPLVKQRKGLFWVAGFVDSLRAVVNASRHGASPDDIVDLMRSQAEFANYAPNSCRMVYSLVRNLGFLENRNGLWFPSAEGEQLVNDDPPDVLVEKLLVQVYGMAQPMVYLGAKGQASKKDTVAFIRSLWPTWTTDFAPRSILGWLTALDLVSDTDGVVTLTSYGQYWHNRLPALDELPTTDAVPSEDELSPLAIPVQAAPFTGLAFSDFYEAFKKHPRAATYVFGEEQLKALHLAWHCNPNKRFVLLSGLSGTGKTQILSLYADVYCQCAEVNPEEHKAIIAVSPDWRDPSGLLGYVNSLRQGDETYHVEPALQILLRAARSPHMPFFLVLDEMNLARVERYFAPFLSAMETGDKIVLHTREYPISDIPAAIPWPRNLFIAGTVNMDETTHAFSDKVLDRAFTMEYWDVDLAAFFQRRSAESNRDARLEGVLTEVHATLRDIRRHFGYRTAGEVMDFVDLGRSVGDSPAAATSLIDQAIFSKVLPRIRGEDSEPLTKALQKLQKLFADEGLTRCESKVLLMLEQLRGVGMTRFWA